MTDIVTFQTITHDIITLAGQAPAPPVWGGIGGLLGNQGDLVAALNGKASTATFTATVAGLVPASGGGTLNFLRADGTWAVPPAGGGGGAVLGVGYAESSLPFSTVALLQYTAGIPKQTDGIEILTCSYTPKSASSRILVEAHLYLVTMGANEVVVALFKDAALDAIGADYCYGAYVTIKSRVVANILSSSLTPITFKLRIGGNNGVNTIIVNSNTAGIQILGGLPKIWIKVTEYQ